MNKTQTISIENALNLDNYLWIDVRSEKEYLDGTIPSAINMPLFDNEERTLVGTMYKQIGKEEAKEKGLEIASAKLSELYKHVKELSSDHEGVIIFCWRGGMRSSSVVRILDMMGIFNVFQMVGGYKAYRQYVLNQFEEWSTKKQFIVLHGSTGVGKTLLLCQLKQEGYPVLDLEDLANHRGSYFGAVGLGEQPTQKNFESVLYKELKKNTQRLIFVESESGKVGKLFVPSFITNGIKNGIHIHITCPTNIRIQRLIQEYVGVGEEAQEELINSLNHLKQSLSKKMHEQIKVNIEEEAYEEVAATLLEEYYDPLYLKWIHRYEPFEYQVDSSNLRTAVDELMKIYRNISK